MESLDNIFLEAQALTDPTERAAFLAAACGADADLRARIEAMLKDAEGAAAFFGPEQELPRPAGTTPLTEGPGTVIGRYKLLQKIGEGGMGVVYMAEQREPVVRKVALKIIKLGMDTRQVIARFEAERQALALMDHPNIARALDGGATDSGRPFFVMELVRGIPITRYCDENALPPNERLKLFVQVCQAVQHAHQKGIIHRDLKPSNIFVTVNDDVPVPKVIDFGIAKATEGRLTDKTVFTAFEQFIGTPAYMSPEQAAMTTLDIDTRSDIYSLGVLLYELLTGRTPFAQSELLAAGLDEMRRMIREKEPLKPSTRLTQELVAADVSRRKSTDREQKEMSADSRRRLQTMIPLLRGDLDWIVMKCLEKNRTRRYETANGLATDIKRHLNNEPVVARPPSRLYRLQKLVRRNKLSFAAGSAVTAALILGLGLSTWLFVKERKSHDRAVAAEEAQSQSRQRAEANEKIARTEATRSAQVAEFLKAMLKGVGPSVALGRDTEMLREILDQTAERVGKDLKAQPEVEAELLTTLGTAYFELGEARKAIELHRKALELRRALFGETNNLVATSFRELGDALELAEEFQKAESAYRQSLAIRRQLFVGDHPDLARSLSLFGGMASSNGKLREAEAALREALAMQRRLFPEGNEDLAVTLDGLGNFLHTQGRLAEAEAIDRESVQLRNKLFGVEHPNLAIALARLGRVLLAEGKLAEAETTLREGYLMRRKLYGNDHQYVISALSWLAESLDRQGKFAVAETVLRDNLERRQQTTPHSSTARAFGLLAMALLGQNKLSEAEGVRREALAIRKSLNLKQAENSDASALNEAAWFLATCDEGGFRDGPQAVQLAGKAVQATDRKVPNFLDTLAAAYAEAGQFDQAVSVQKEAMGLLQNTNQVADFASRLNLYLAHKPCREFGFQTDAANWLATGASYLLEHGKAVEAETPARVCLALRQQVLPDDWPTFNARSMLGGSLLGQKKYAEAEPLLRSGYEGLKRCENQIPASVRQTRPTEALERLVQLYEAWGKPDAAAHWRAQLPPPPR